MAYFSQFAIKFFIFLPKPKKTEVLGVIMGPIRFSQKPYKVTYNDFHTGERKTVTRRPPPKIHDMLPTDIVSLSSKKNDTFDVGDEVTIKHVSYRHPNILQLQNEDGETTFVPSRDVRLEQEVAYRGRPQIDDEKANRYLVWP